MKFAASQIARRLGRKRQAIQRLLQGVPPDGRIVIGGNTAAAWSVHALPESLRSELTRRAKAGGFRDATHFLSASDSPWQPPVPLSHLAQYCVEKAVKVQRALARVLALQNDLSISSTELERIGLDDYQREFGHSITARYLRELIKRTLDRDGNRGEFQRVELYLDDRPARKVESKPAIPLSVQDDFAELLIVIEKMIKNRANPTNAERELIWARAVELHDELGADGVHKPKKLKNALVAFLTRNAPFLAANRNAMRVALNRRLHDPSLCKDNRHGNSGFHRAPDLSDSDRDALIAHAVLNCGGRVSQAWRELIARNALSENLLSYYIANPASKSYCPTRIREAIRNEITMMDDIHHGPRTDKLNGAHLSRDWSGVASMDWLCADDCTLEVYTFVPDGKDWFTLTRGQFLPMIDVRSTRILGYAFLPEKSYNARAIRTLITKVCDEHGLPRKGFYFEQGIWKNSRILTGDPNATPLSWAEAELGLRSFGLRFKHSVLPRSKPIERVLGAIQDLMDGEPGFVGGNEMKEKYERVQRHKRDVEARRVHPSELFYGLDDWIKRLDEFCEQYNSERQDGKMTCGLSPNDAFEKFARNDDPPIKFSPGCRYLLAHHKRPVRVGNNGITLRFGKESYNYRNEQTGKLRGQEVLTWFNPEVPEILTVTDMKRENPFCIERSQSVPAMDAPAEIIEQEQARIAAHMNYARTRYRTLKARFAVPFRRTIPDAQTVELGTEIARQSEQLTARRNEEDKLQKQARKVLGRLGMTAAGRPIQADRIDAAQRLAELLEQEEENS